MHECNNEQGRNRGIEEAETGDLTGGRLNKRRACTRVCVCVCVRTCECVYGSKPPWAMLFRISRFKEKKKNPYALNDLLVGIIDHRYIDIDGHVSIFELRFN